MAKLVSLRLSKAEAKAEMSGPPRVSDAPRYPYGSCIRLEGDVIEKLGLDKLEVGARVTIEAEGIVEMYSEEERQGKEPERRASIQITDLAIVEAADSRREKKKAAHFDEIARPRER